MDYVKLLNRTRSAKPEERGPRIAGAKSAYVRVAEEHREGVRQAALKAGAVFIAEGPRAGCLYVGTGPSYVAKAYGVETCLKEAGVHCHVVLYER